jgi:hypothetical protein
MSIIVRVRVRVHVMNPLTAQVWRQKECKQMFPEAGTVRTRSLRRMVSLSFWQEGLRRSKSGCYRLDECSLL